MARHDREQNDIQALGEQLRKQTEGTPEREAFLQDLAADIKAGRYQVDAKELAQKLIDEAIKSEPRNAARGRRRRQPPSR